MRTVRKLVPDIAAAAIESVFSIRRPSRVVAKHMFIYEVAKAAGWDGVEVAEVQQAPVDVQELDLSVEFSDEDHPQSLPEGVW